MVSAPGKLLLLGEHAVVYGYPCIVTAIDRRMAISVKNTQIATNGIHSAINNTTFVEKALEIGTKAWNLPSNGWEAAIEKSFPNTYGFGSSSAVTVATLSALAEAAGKSPTKQELFGLAFQVVLSVQGVGSGFDVAAAIWGGTIFYKNKGQLIEEVPFDEKDVSFIVGYTDIKADTTTLIQEVAKKKREYPQKVEKIFQGIEKLVVEAKQRIQEKDWERVGRLMDFNQEYLRDLGVSSQKLEDLIVAAKKAGAWGAKLSGAGGGDCMIALVGKEKREEVETAITKAGGEIVPVKMNEEGVKTI